MEGLKLWCLTQGLLLDYNDQPKKRNRKKTRTEWKKSNIGKKQCESIKASVFIISGTCTKHYIHAKNGGTDAKLKSFMKDQYMSNYNVQLCT